jgi:hypothetical protein
LERVRQNLKENYYWMMIKYDLKIFWMKINNQKLN